MARSSITPAGVDGKRCSEGSGPRQAGELGLTLPGRLEAYDFFTAIWRLLSAARGSSPERQTPSGLRFFRAPGAGGPLEREPLRLKVSPELSFPTSELASISRPDAEGPVYVTTHLPGLHGALSPLPLTYATEVLQKQDDQPQLAAFLDLLHHRLLGLLYQGVVQHHPERMWSGDGSDPWSSLLAVLNVLAPQEEDSSQAAVPVSDSSKEPPLAPFASGLQEFAGLHLSSPTLTADALELLASRLVGLPVEVVPLLSGSVVLSESALPMLTDDELLLRKQHRAPYRLGHSLLGQEVSAMAYRFSLRIHVDTWETLTRFLEEGPDHQALTALVQQEAGPLWEVQLLLQVPAHCLPVTTLAGAQPARLGSPLPLGEVSAPWLELAVPLGGLGLNSARV